MGERSCSVPSAMYRAGVKTTGLDARRFLTCTVETNPSSTRHKPADIVCAPGAGSAADVCAGAAVDGRCAAEGAVAADRTPMNIDIATAELVFSKGKSPK